MHVSIARSRRPSAKNVRATHHVAAVSARLLVRCIVTSPFTVSMTARFDLAAARTGTAVGISVDLAPLAIAMRTRLLSRAGRAHLNVIVTVVAPIRRPIVRTGLCRTACTTRTRIVTTLDRGPITEVVRHGYRMSTCFALLCVVSPVIGPILVFMLVVENMRRKNRACSDRNNGQNQQSTQHRHGCKNFTYFLFVHAFLLFDVRHDSIVFQIYSPQRKYTDTLYHAYMQLSSIYFHHPFPNCDRKKR